MPLAQSQPADARRQALERDARACHVEPPVQMRVVGEQFLDLAVGLIDVFRITRQRHPAKRPLAFAEERPDVSGDESRKVERIAQTFVLRNLPDVVAVVERRDALRVKGKHRLDVRLA